MPEDSEGSGARDRAFSMLGGPGGSGGGALIEVCWWWWWAYYIFPVALPAAKKKCNCHFVVMLFDTHLFQESKFQFFILYHLAFIQL